jgi:hypothetical protein
LRYQSGVFSGREAQHEIFGKAPDIALDGLVEAPGGHTIDTGQIAIQYHPAAAQEKIERLMTSTAMDWDRR